MKLTVSRSDKQRWECAGSMFFAATNEAGEAVTVDVSMEAWETIRIDRDPIAKVEAMAADPRAHWEPFGAERVWRVYS